MNKVLAVCIEPYLNETDMHDYPLGRIGSQDVQAYEKGDIGLVVPDYVDESFWTTLEEADPLQLNPILGEGCEATINSLMTEWDKFISQRGVPLTNSEEQILLEEFLKEQRTDNINKN